MAKFRKIHTSFWDDPLIEKLSPDARYFYLFLMTNPHCTECGIYQITIKKMCNYTGYNEDSIKALIRLLEVENSRIVYDTSTEEVCILKKPNYIDRLGKPVHDCLFSEFKKIKNKKLIYRQIQHLEREEVKLLYDTWYDTYIVSLRSCGTMRGEEKEEEEEEEKEKEGLDFVAKEQEKLPIVQQMLKVWKEHNPDYKTDDDDKGPLRKLAVFISGKQGIEHFEGKERDALLESWGNWCFFIMQSNKYKTFSLDKISKFYAKEIHQNLLGGSNSPTVKKMVL